ncbi:putative mitochondrial dihydrolipoamide dehydrogenase, putative (GCVL-1) [Leptomonas pyrrhocoris]|uniref:Putative mitochondrial dihydrolipoamide dehydrogenase, putative (GCVL-1) n=1 Tax=Leptomonas pyrrhocoris TaxID=157538 RepID=A0A0M9G1Z8_LEPPY|nr:putative mitochondrial dihydrolipoamide dehydrogenase, putative (GCVL-1) [Leptomonas pyrrhocoris]KPA80567.1 putative mitochondrial dihydrolipoamide dehydrogenase, putative (GCVL-1) [Leptomonas pyrrhocoris]|eukprot:XP_015659006.1 putative mitochondrial dihydrolipoamide dehydrogenase, putative (GCVL-1) [Leptomonas pyrrhocoris]
MMRRTFLSRSKKFDVCVLGGGPAGIAAAIRAYEVGKKACIIEEARIGGADFWNGSLQSKTLWEMAKFARYTSGNTSQRFMKIIHELPPIKHENLIKAIDHAAETREAQVLELMKNSEIELINGSGSFKTPNLVAVAKKDGSKELVEADYFVIATGAKPRPHPTAIADGKVVFTSDDIMYQPLPKSIVIIGAGVIGCEFASIFANFGETQVNIIEKSSRILPMEDEDISLFVQTLLEQKGVCFHHHSALEANSVKDGKFCYTLRDLRDNSLHDHVTDSALVSIGRVPKMSKLNLEGLGVKVDHNRVERDDFLRITPFRHIYACGDACTRVALVNVAELEGRACIEHMYTPLPEDQLKLKLDNLSTIMFLDQEVAAVGLNEQQCKKAKIGYKMARYSYEYVGRALAMGNTRGFIKLVVTNDRKMQVLGVRAVGPHASSIIELASLAIHNRESAYNLRNLHTAYPAITQGFQECLHMLLGSSILKPGVFPNLVIQEWNPPNFEHGRAYAN